MQVVDDHRMGVNVAPYLAIRRNVRMISLQVGIIVGDFLRIIGGPEQRELRGGDRRPVLGMGEADAR